MSIVTGLATQDLFNAGLPTQAVFQQPANEMVTPTPCEGYAFAGCFSLEAILMNNLALAGIDPGKHGFHLPGPDSAGREVFRKKATRQQMMRLLGNLPACTVERFH